ncbi:competence type IV pilus minor pilin ComGG [Bacillus sp. AFS031507]|uniref:competence type IV pilus minor pilin ComGG n=1 Tax=Bacillus sp. AFS031507 TaxID=2033496 RepID=UPI0015D51D8C|nr:competence type IV pilus minor pilin ComGG [Bacillus sp. AFS031507]
MKNNEKGFTYPLTLCLIIIFLLFFSVRIEQLLSERKMAHETAIILQEEYYFLSSVKKVEVIFQKSGILPVKGTISFVNGTMDYKAETPNGYVQKVNFTLHLLAVDKTFIGRGYFDTRTKRLSNWVELK